MNLAGLVQHYVRKYRPKAEKELNWFRQQPSLDAAISVAALAINSSGKRYPHQYKIPRSALPKALAELLAARGQVDQCQSFHELLHVVRRTLTPIRGLGE